MALSKKYMLNLVKHHRSIGDARACKELFYVFLENAMPNTLVRKLNSYEASAKDNIRSFKEKRKYRQSNACLEAVRTVKNQHVNIDGEWYGSTICFTGQMYDKEGCKISRADVRLIANEIGLVWLDNVTFGCVFLVTGK